MVVIFGAGEKVRLTASKVGIENVMAFADNDEKRLTAIFKEKSTVLSRNRCLFE